MVTTAVVTAFGSEAVKNWIPSLVSYGWNVATRSKITYVTVAYGDPSTAVPRAEVRAHDPATHKEFQTTKTDPDGNAVLRDISPDSFFVTVSFTAGDKLVRGQKQLTIHSYAGMRRP